MVVDQILDVAEEAVTVRQKSRRKGLLGSAVVGSRVTDFLDLNEVILAAEGSWFQSSDQGGSQKRVLVVDASAFSRGMIRSGLDMAGYLVVEAAGADEAITRMEREPVDVVVASLDLPSDGACTLLAAMRRRPAYEKIPVLALAGSAAQVRASSLRTEGFDDCQAKFDGMLVLESVAHMISPPTTNPMAACVLEKR
jgi:CheY-like chemotaxis protein